MELQGVNSTEIVTCKNCDHEVEVLPKTKDLEPDKFVKNNIDPANGLTASVTASTGLVA